MSYYIFCVHLKQKVKPNCDVLFWQITNLGRSLKYFTNASLSIFWPKENSAGKWLLYLTQTSSKGVQSVPCSPVNEINSLKDVKVTHAFCFLVELFYTTHLTCYCVELRVGRDSPGKNVKQNLRHSRVVTSHFSRQKENTKH